MSRHSPNMSLDNTSRPGRPGLEELVPSRYALQVGEIDVLVVSDGVLTLPGVARDNQGETAASIRMRMRRGWTAVVRA